jgi:myo-inositol-1(or 4)-monophosphatase
VIAPKTGLAIAREVVAAAAELLGGAAGNVGRVWTKSTLRDLVTEWDLKSEQLIRTMLADATPDVPVLGEEAGRSGESGGEFRWVVDPIDGTVNFSHGIPIWSITVALEKFGSPIAGVVAAPALGWEFFACEGGGAFMNDEPIRVSAVPTLDQAILASGFPYDRARTRHNFPQWEHFLRTAGACRRMGAASLDLAMVARGWLDGYWETRLSPWDLSAGALLVREAGGTVTGITGEAFQSDTGHAVASNGAIHDQILAELKVVGIPGSERKP